MTEIITAEMRAAMERLRAANYWRSDPINGQYWDGDDYDQDAAMVIDAMLSLFPGDMPEPVEMWAYEKFGMRTAVDWRDDEDIRGIFIPLQRVDQ